MQILQTHNLQYRTTHSANFEDTAIIQFLFVGAVITLLALVGMVCNGNLPMSKAMQSSPHVRID